MVHLSVVTTMYASAPYLQEFYRRASAAAREITDDYELIFVNDGSPDDSLQRALEFYRADEHVRVIDFARNFGHHKAMMTGLAHARGALGFVLDCDLEEAPELLKPFHLTLLEKGADVVYGVQRTRHGGLFERMSARTFYLAFNWLSTDPIPENLITARLMTGRYVRALISHRERQTQIAGLWAITGFTQVPLEVDKGRKGDTSYTLRRKVSHLVNAVTSFSDKPLIMIFYVGGLITIISMLAAGYLVVRRVFFGA